MKPLIFNELSLAEEVLPDDRYAAQSALCNLCDILLAYNRAWGGQEIKILLPETNYRGEPINLYNAMLVKNQAYHLGSGLKDLPFDKRQLLLGALTSKPFLKKSPPYYYFKGKDCIGFGAAIEGNYFATISFNSIQEWKEQNYEIDAEDDNLSVKCMVEHIPNPSHITSQQVEKWRNKAKIYDINSRTPPSDPQTILADTNRFAPTNRTYHNRKIYKQHCDGSYWYVDNFHVGASAELEVFDNNNQHLGAADITTGILKPNSKVEGRTLPNS